MDSPQRNYLYLSISLVSGYCTMMNTYTIPCANMVGILCAGELFFLKKKDMIFHHIIVMFFVHYMNTHTELEYMIRNFLQAEISTIFLTTRNLIGGHPVNDACFVMTFMYYRIYKFSTMLWNPHTHEALLVHSKTPYELCEIYMSMYLFFMLNVYWASLIVAKLYRNKRVKGSDETKQVHQSVTT